MTDQEPTEAGDAATYIAEIERLSMDWRRRAETAEAALRRLGKHPEECLGPDTPCTSHLALLEMEAQFQHHEPSATTGAAQMLRVCECQDCLRTRLRGAEAALAKMTDRLLEVEQERNEAFASCDRYRLAPFGGGFRFQWQDRAEAAEAQVRELRGLIVEILQGEDDGFYWDESPGCTLTERMRAALARIPGPEPSK